MTTQEEETNFDPFEEEVTTTTDEDAPADTEEEVADAEEGEEADDTEDETTDDSDEETDSTDEDDTSNEKMIPESRFKAALKDIQEKLDNVTQENATLKAVPAPDRNTDPEGYEQHLRLEVSKQLMQEKEDYVETIKHYQEMAKANPTLNEMVAKHELPAKLAYDLAKRDMEIREMTEARNSDEWKEFQEFKKSKGKTSVADELATPTDKVTKLPKNLNRATASTPKKGVQSDDGYLWGDAAF